MCILAEGRCMTCTGVQGPKALQTPGIIIIGITFTMIISISITMIVMGNGGWQRLEHMRPNIGHLEQQQ